MDTISECFIFNLLLNKLNRSWSVEKEVSVLLMIRAEEWHNGHTGRNLLNKFLLLHILMINLMINLPSVSSGYSELYCRSGANRKLGGAAMSGCCRKTMQQSGGGGRGARTERRAGVT